MVEKRDTWKYFLKINSKIFCLLLYILLAVIIFIGMFSVVTGKHLYLIIKFWYIQYTVFILKIIRF